MKLTPSGFEIAASTYLEGTNLNKLLSRVKLQTDEQGNIAEHVNKNIQRLLKTATDMTHDESVKAKCQKLLDFMRGE